MNIYNYDPTTLEYLGSNEAFESPKEPGQYLIPAYATSLQPPAVNTNEIAKWNGTSWDTVKDYRGETWYDADGVPNLITQLDDDPTVNSWTATRPQKFTNIEAQETKLREANHHFAQTLQQNVVFNGKNFQANKQSIDNVVATIAVINAGLPIPSDFTWRTADNEDVVMSSAELVNLGAVLFGHVNTIYKANWTIKDAIRAIDPEDVDFQTKLDAITIV